MHSRLPMRSHPACLSLQLLLGSSLCPLPCFSSWDSLAPLILSSGHQILGNSKCRRSLLSFTAHVESVKLDFSKAGSFCAEFFSWSERQSAPVPPELCLTNSSGKSLGFFQALIQSFLAGFFYLNTSSAAFLFAVA